MKITKLMDEHYKGLLLTPRIYHSLDLGIHIELGEDIYQIKGDGKLNMKRFHTVFRQVAEIFPLLFKKKDDVIVVVNSYPSVTNKIVYPNFFQRYVKVQQKNIHYACKSLFGNLMKMMFLFSKWNCSVKFQI